jgi:HD-GYP domain-containing protein (c-di-GMP phosphodiesterase class II)
VLKFTDFRPHERYRLKLLSTSIIIASSNENWAKETREKIVYQGLKCEIVLTGKECQLAIYKNRPTIALLDVNIEDQPVIEVLNYIKLNHPNLKVFLAGSTKEILNLLNNGGCDPSSLRPFKISLIPEYLRGLDLINQGKEFNPIGLMIPEEGQRTGLLESLKREQLPKSPLHLFNLYEATSTKAKFKSGEKLLEEDVPEEVYFITSEKNIFSTFLDEASQKMFVDHSKKQKVQNFQELFNKYIPEHFTEGIQTVLFEEGKAICENALEKIDKDPELRELMESIKRSQPGIYAHSLLTCFYSGVISKKMDWVGPRTIDTVALGGMLHDIGIIKLPKQVLSKDLADLSADEKIIYEQHPQLGMELLENISIVNDQVKQIIYQHHEYFCGSGFPNNITSNRIYPLAKIVILADEITHIMLSQNLSPLETIKQLLSQRRTVVKFDPTVIKALIRCFISDSKDQAS